MSILIKGLKLPPVGIRQCIVSFADNCLLITDVCGKILFEGEYVEIPTPHGKLIDADVLLDTIRYGAEGRAICDKCKSQDCQNCVIKSVYKIIRKAPIVIEAEVSEE